jgi:SAM-dependent methyltransferase
MSQPLSLDNVNYQYFVRFVQSLDGWQHLRVLDYGCGSGQLVAVLRRAGIDAVGCDVYYEGGSDPTGEIGRIRDELLRSGAIRHIPEEGDLPFDPGAFDVIVANQVFENVRDLPVTLARVRRVLKPDGRMLLHFPSLEVIREGHIGIPFAHWLRLGSSFRLRYALALRRLGLGYFKGEKDPTQWTEDALRWIDEYCYYRPYRAIRTELDPWFTVEHPELPYIRFRSAGRLLIGALAAIDTLGPLWERLFRRLAFMALLLRPRQAAP